MGLEFQATGAGLLRAAAAVLAPPFTFAARFFAPTVHNGSIITVEDAATGGHRWRLCIQSSGFVRFQAVQAGAGSNIDSGVAYTANEWHSAIGQEVTREERYVWLDGIRYGPNTTSRDPTGVDQTQIGRAEFSSAQQFLGILAEITAWERILTDEECQAYASGESGFRIRETSHLFYLPAHGLDPTLEPDLAGQGFHFTPSGAVVAARHAPVRHFLSPAPQNVQQVAETIPSAAIPWYRETSQPIRRRRVTAPY